MNFRCCPSAPAVAGFALAVALLVLAFSLPAMAKEGESYAVVGSKGALVLWEVKRKDGSVQYVLNTPKGGPIQFRQGTTELEARKALFALYVAHKRAKCAERAGTEEFKACVEEPLDQPDNEKCMRNWTLEKMPGITKECG